MADIALSSKPGYVWIALSRDELRSTESDDIALSTMKQIRGVGIRLLDGVEMPVGIPLRNKRYRLKNKEGGGVRRELSGCEIGVDDTEKGKSL